MHRLRAAAVAGVIPWIPAVPPAQPVPRLAPPCRAAALRAELGLQGATGSLAGGVVLTNRGRSVCSLRGNPRARFLDGVDPSGVERTALPAFDRPSGTPHSSLRALHPGESAFVRLWWSNWCGRPSPMRLALTVSGAEFDLRVDGSSRCDAASAPSTLAVGPLETRELQPRTGSQLPLSAAIVDELHLGPKAVPGVRARAARTAVFHVGLTNTSSSPYRFGATCPSYVEGTGLGERTESHLLNCRPVGAIGPGETAVFEMHVRVPGRATGRIPLTWTLAPATYLPPFAGGVIVVLR